MVTGASEGVGLAVAHRLATDGWRVAMLARASSKLDGAVAQVAATAPTRDRVATAVDVDLTDSESVTTAIAEAARVLGGIDAVVNCASATRSGSSAVLTDDQWVQGFEVKVHGSRRMIEAAWPHLSAAGGAVVNIGGIGARTPRDAHAMTGPLSAALLALTKVYAERGTEAGVRVNAINPGAITTPRLLQSLESAASREGVDLDRFVETMVIRDQVTRLGRPEDVAGVVAFLLSPDAEWFHGAVLDLDGGRTKGL